MARKSTNGESRSAYFRRVFDENPEWLKLGRNDPIYERWIKDNGSEMSENEKATMANIKSKMRADQGIESRTRRKKGRKKGSPNKSTAAAARVAAPVAPRIAKSDVEKLEVLIDESLYMARGMNVQGMDTIVKHLRKARNNIVLMFDLKE